MSTLVFDIVYPSGYSVPVEYEAPSDRQVLHFLVAAINQDADSPGTVKNVRIY